MEYVIAICSKVCNILATVGISTSFKRRSMLDFVNYFHVLNADDKQ